MHFRKIYDKQKDIIENDKICFIVWPRQVGKTTFIKKIFEEIHTDNKQYLNMENFEYHRFFQSVSDIENFINNTIVEKNKKYYLFLDEFQKVKNISPILKYLYDEHKNIKIIVSGSNNIEINKNIKESFAWRKRIYYMRPLDIQEFISWKENIDIKNTNSFIKNPKNKYKLENYIQEFWIYGWFPKVVLARSSKDKIQELADIFDFWFNRDIVLYTNKLYEFKELTRQLAFNNWNTANYSSLASLSHISAPSVKKFIQVLKETFLVIEQKPFFNNKLKEINKSPKIYFLDPGFRNYIISRYDFSSQEFGILFENIMLSDLIKNWLWYDDLKFWRTNDENYEVDLILESQKKAYEFKWKDKLKSSDKSWLNKFLKTYPDFDGETIDKNNIDKLDFI